MAKLSIKTAQEIKIAEEKQASIPSSQDRDNQNKSILFALRETIDISTLTVEGIEKVKYIYPSYEQRKKYMPKALFLYDDTLYEVVYEHTSQEDWVPDQEPSIYKIARPDGYVDEWREPLGYQDAYTMGERVKYKGKIYESTHAQNTWEPTEASVWKLIKEV